MLRSLFASTVAKDFIWRIIFTFAKQGIVLYIFVLTAKSLDIQSFGSYNYVLSAIFFLILLCDFGVSTATSKYVAQYHATENEKLKQVVFNALVMVCAFVVLAGAIIAFLGPLYFQERYIYFLYFSPLIFLVPATSIYDGVYRGLKRFREGALIATGVGFLFLFIAPILIFNFGMVGSILSQDLFYTVLFILFVIVYKNFHVRFNFTIIKEIGKYSLLYGLAVLSYQIFARIDVLFLGHYGYFEQIATYELLNKIFSVLVIPFTLLGQVLAPRFTELFYAKKDYKKIYLSLQRYTLIFLAGSITVASICYILIPWITARFFPAYVNAHFNGIFVVSLLIFTINIATATIDHGMIVATGYAKLMTWLYSALAIVNLGLNVFAVKYFGYMGILYATLICVILMVVGLRVLFFLELRKMSKKEVVIEPSIELI